MSRSPFANAGATRATPHPALDPTAVGAGEDEPMQRLVRDLRLGRRVARAMPRGSLALAAVTSLGDARGSTLAITGAAEVATSARPRRCARQGCVGNRRGAAHPVAGRRRSGFARSPSLPRSLHRPRRHGSRTTPSPFDRGFVEQATAIALVRASWRLPAVVLVPLARVGGPKSVSTTSGETTAAALGGARRPTRVRVASPPAYGHETGRARLVHPVGVRTERFVRAKHVPLAVGATSGNAPFPSTEAAEPGLLL
jgi:hypothetical protein